VSRRWESASWEARHLNNLGNTVREEGREPEVARRLQEASLTIFTRLGSAWGIAMAACDLAFALLDLGEEDEARDYLANSLELRERMREPQGVAQSLKGLARLERLKGEYEMAEEHSRTALRLFDEIGDGLRVAESFEALAMTAAASERPRRAARLFAAATEVRGRAGAIVPPVMQRDYAASIDAVRDKLGPDEYRLEEEAGRRLSLQQAIAEA
jgi:tetratricopeptide (TPR) repeat protein